MFNRHSGGTASSNPLDPSPERVAPRWQALLELAMRCVRRPGPLGFSASAANGMIAVNLQKPLSRSIAALLELAPAAAWARIVTSRSQRPRTVKGFAQCGTLFRPPPLPISIGRHYTRRKQIHELGHSPHWGDRGGHRFSLCFATFAGCIVAPFYRPDAQRGWIP
jgi:hypothetical protein